MTIKVTELLKLISKANQLDLIVEVCENKDGDYGIRVYEENSYLEAFGEKVVITQKGESDYGFDAMMNALDEKLEEKQKRQELLARLTDEEKYLLLGWG